MENVIKAPADVTVASIEIEKGKTVEKNQVMVRFS
jgi:biotin carboxyl carrier protein